MPITALSGFVKEKPFSTKNITVLVKSVDGIVKG